MLHFCCHLQLTIGCYLNPYHCVHPHLSSVLYNFICYMQEFSSAWLCRVFTLERREGVHSARQTTAVFAVSFLAVSSAPAPGTTAAVPSVPATTPGAQAAGGTASGVTRQQIQLSDLQNILSSMNGQPSPHQLLLSSLFLEYTKSSFFFLYRIHIHYPFKKRNIFFSLF